MALGLPFELHVGARGARRHRRGAAGSEPVLRASTSADVRAAGAAQHWLQASNPSERWKWDFMFQDLPPVKGKRRGDVFAAAGHPANGITAERIGVQMPRLIEARTTCGAHLSTLAADSCLVWRALPAPPCSRRHGPRRGREVTPLVEQDGAARRMRRSGRRCTCRCPKASTSNPNKPRDPSLIPIVADRERPAGRDRRRDRVPAADRPRQAARRQPLARLRARVRRSASVCASRRARSPVTSTIPVRLRYQACDEKLCYLPTTRAVGRGRCALAQRPRRGRAHPRCLRRVSRFGTGEAPRRSAAPRPRRAAAAAARRRDAGVATPRPLHDARAPTGGTSARATS